VSQPPATRLANVRVLLRVTVDRAKWGENVSQLEEDVRNFCVEELSQHPLIHSVRRDGR
jgi:hypothetical protein